VNTHAWQANRGTITIPLQTAASLYDGHEILQQSGRKWGYVTVLSSFHGDWKIRAQPLNADDTGMQEPATASATADSPKDRDPTHRP
jgi:hypothetical protein